MSSRWSAYADKKNEKPKEVYPANEPATYVVPAKRNNPNEPVSKSLIAREREQILESGGDLKEFRKEEPNFELSGLLQKDEQTDKSLDRKFVAPKDARKPIEHGWRLFVFKGNSIDKEARIMKLYKGDHFIFGKDQRICHVTLNHQTVSREHCAICFRIVDHDRDIRPFIMDLGSSNGTKLNGKKLKPFEFLEIKEQDVINFGYSQRDYVLMKDVDSSIQDYKFSENDNVDEIIGNTRSL